MSLKIYNTMTREKEVFEPLEAGKVRMYVCGPTVYDKAHVGHAMSALVFDIIRRYLEYRGYDVTYAMNFTDVDDKIISRANEKGIDPFKLAEGFIDEFIDNLRGLNIKPATIHPRATQEIPYIIDMVSKMMDNGAAYAVDGDVYFRVEKYDSYGKLSGRKLEDMNAGSRIQVDDRKENPMDFAVWKSAKPGEPAWDSPWGKGRPGWHIECSAMNLHHLGQQIDIHGGGNDLIFPHHENEIAQTEAVTGKPFARYWMHNGMLQLKGEKMSKSLGNLITIEEFLSRHSGDVMRLTVINASYRSPLTFSNDVLEQTGRALERLHSARKPALPGAKGAPSATLENLNTQAEKTRQGFIECMDDDFNTAGAIGTIFDLVRQINQARADGATDAQLADAQAVFTELTQVLGFELKTSENSTSNADAFIDLLIELRQDMRTQKQWALSDKIRNRLTELGVMLEDSKEGTTWHWA